MKKHMTQDVAIKSAWMILEGLGFSREINGDLEKTVAAVFESAPAADVVEVVKCADCRSFQCNIRQDENGNLVVPVGVSKFECRWWCAEVSPKDYCSYAKRKESDNG